MFRAKIRKTSQFFILNNHFTAVKNHNIVHGRVIVIDFISVALKRKPWSQQDTFVAHINLVVCTALIRVSLFFSEFMEL